jgi:protein-S-isoprenylcysteine O-methyltransferase Ste14
MGVILSSLKPSSPLSQQILDIFVAGSTPVQSTSKIRLTPSYLVGWLFTIVGALIRLSCYRALGTLFTFELSIRKGHKLITSGPYAVVRHPSYTGAILGGVGIVMCQLCEGSWARECTKLGNSSENIQWVWVVVGVLIVWGITRRTRKEDNMLKEQFGSEWEVWRKAVPWKIFPGVW